MFKSEFLAHHLSLKLKLKYFIVIYS